MTVVKRQAQSPAGVSSEVEVLKALKSLFEHHKALDEKVREKLRVSLDRINQLEEDLSKATEEVNKLQKEKKVTSETNDIMANGHVSLSEVMCGTSFEDTELSELKLMLEKQSNDLHSSRSRLGDLNNKTEKLEDMLKVAEATQAQTKEENLKLRETLRENNSQKEDQEERIATLEKRYLNAQRESTSIHDLNEKLEHELANKEAQLKLCEEKINALTEKLELSEQRLSQIEFVKRQEALIREASEETE